MSLFISFLAGVSTFHLYLYYPYTAAAFFLSASVFLLLKKRSLLLFVIATGILYALIRADGQPAKTEKYYTAGIRQTVEQSEKSHRERLNSYFRGNFEKDTGGLLMALTTGERAHIPADLNAAFNSTGLGHLLSISGTHFGLFSVVLFTLFRVVIIYLPSGWLERLTLYITPSQAAAVLCLPPMLFYLGLSGGNIPTVRSFIMVSMFLTGLLIERKGFWLNSIIFAAFLLVLWEPSSLFDLTFQLSFIAVLFIGWAVKGVSPQKEGDDYPATGASSVWRGMLYDRPIYKYLIKSLAVTFSATFGTAILIAYYFNYISLISPLTNLVVTPLIGFLLVPASIFSSLIYLLTGHYPGAYFIEWVSAFSIYLVNAFSGIRFASVGVPKFPPILIVFFYAGVFLFSISKGKLSAGLSAVLFVLPVMPIVFYFILNPSVERPLTVTFLEVGMADSVVVELPDGKVIVVDTGRYGGKTAGYLRSRAKKTIDALILTHAHPDHSGGLGYLLENFRVLEIWDNGKIQYPEALISGVRLRHLERGDFIEGRGWKMDVLHPYKGFYTAKGEKDTAVNNDSLVLKLTAAGRSILFAGDIEAEAEEDLLHLGSLLKSDVLKVPHHGGMTSAFMPFIESVSPKVSIISAGRAPHPETTTALGTSKILNTLDAGAIKVALGKDIKIKTHSDFKIKETSSLNGEIQNIKNLFKEW